MKARTIIALFFAISLLCCRNEARTHHKTIAIQKSKAKEGADSVFSKQARVLGNGNLLIPDKKKKD
ncbi:MAG TPA: hypothetical protein VFR70_06805 [Flavobacterium sp.]|nr:hypothetical protein [Flavobacterium sp.]